MSDKITGILLAAGASSRFGSNKLLHPLPDSGTPIAVQAAKNLLNAVPNSIAVVRPGDLKLKALLAETGITIVENPHASAGMSSSIRCGIKASINKNSANADSPEGWLVSLADMPYLSTDIYQSVKDAINNGALLCAPLHQNRRGHPVGFSRLLEDELAELTGDSGASSVIEKHWDQLVQIPVSSKTILHDIDYPDNITAITVK